MFCCVQMSDIGSLMQSSFCSDGIGCVLQPDGNCLYRAVEDQLAVEHGSSGSSQLGHEELRAQAADYMRSHEKEFAPFVLPVRLCCRSAPRTGAESRCAAAST